MYFGFVVHSDGGWQAGNEYLPILTLDLDLFLGGWPTSNSDVADVLLRAAMIVHIASR